MTTEKLLSAEKVSKLFPLSGAPLFSKKRQFVHACEDISLTVFRNETVGLVGESGSGKSTFGRLLLQFYRPTSGRVVYHRGDHGPDAEEIELSALSPKAMRPLRRELQMIFQDPYSSLDPRMTVGEILEEGPATHGFFRKGSSAMRRYIKELMESCGLQPHMYGRYPHEFSGGQRQRVSIARALAVKPRFVVCDECVSALDVSVGAQILNLLVDLKEREKLTYLFISHDLSVVRYLSDRIGVMYLGSLVELGTAEEVFRAPRHPYTAALIASVPTVEADGRGREHITLGGSLPSPVDPPKGCRFHTRCPYACDQCEKERPVLAEITPGHFAACHFAHMTF